ncbi:MAG: ribonuclease P protein component [Candidatus Angelobacter sp.]
MDQKERKKLAKFPRSARLLKRADFQAVYQQGKRHFSGNVTAFYREREKGTGPRIGFTVGKVLGGAVQRNRIRRRMRAAVRDRFAQLNRAVDLVLHPRRSVLDMEFTKLEAEVGQIFSALEKGRGR